MLRVGVWAWVVAWTLASAQAAEPGRRRDVLSPEDWRQLDASVDAGLRYLATQQQPHGSFSPRARSGTRLNREAMTEIGQPAITSLCILAFLSRGHLPHQGEYGEELERAIDFVLQTQHADGLLCGLPIEGRAWGDNRHKAGAYNHAIAGVMLAEVYGMTHGKQSEAIGDAIRKALEFTRAQQQRPKPHPDDDGGWRYLVPTSGFESDLSVTAWEVMFLRSARNAEFDIPVESIHAAMAYVRRTYVPEAGTFAYSTDRSRRQPSRAMAGSGILLLALAGEHETEMARTAGQWILDHPYDRYQRVLYGAEHYHYGAYYCSQAMFQLGGEYWAKFFPPFLRVHVASQRRDGSWPPEMNRDGEYGSIYSTAMMVLSLTPAYQLLPIYQR